MIKLTLILLTLSVVAPTANAASYMDHKATKSLVRLSLWYEGAQSFDKSMFRPGAAEELLKEQSQVAENTPVMTEELTVALDNLDV